MILESKIVTILRGLNSEQSIKVIGALREGGLNVIEVTFDQTQGPSVTASIIKRACDEFQDVCIGAGTVMTMDQLHAANEAGAEFVLAPNTDISIIKETNRLGMISVPGAFSPSEITDCYNAGADIVKVFPASVLGPGFFKAVRGPMPHIPLEAVGGVSLDNICDFLKAGCCSVGIGSNIVDRQAVRENDYSKITVLAKQYKEKIQGIS